MRCLTLTLFTILSLASPALARDISLGLPIDCTLGATCYIQNFVDTDPTDAASDFNCGPLTYDGHKGTDFALPTSQKLRDNVDVLAASAGIVVATRDGMVDHLQGTEGAPDVTGVECGNGLVINHGAGWVTQYCHMKQGSLRVQKGDRVQKGTVLGHVGLSGKTEFPHVHLVVRKDDKVVDPFRTIPAPVCGENKPDMLWDTPLSYQTTGVLSIGVASKVPDYTDVKAGTAQQAQLTTNSPALVVFGFAFGGQQGDVMRLQLTDPNGKQIARHDATLRKNKAQYFNAAGRKSATGWPAGDYLAKVEIIRDGTVMDAQTDRITVTK